MEDFYLLLVNQVVVEALMLVSINSHCFNYSVDQVVIHVLGVLISQHELSFTVVHNKYQVFVFGHLNLMLSVVDDIHLVHDTIIRLADYLVAVLHQPKFSNLVHALLSCFRS